MGTYENERPWVALYADGHPGDLDIEFHDALAMFKAAAARAAERPAMAYFGATLSYAEVDRLSDALAVALLEHGVNRGDRVALFLQNVPPFVIGELAAWKAGAIAVSINPMNKARELGLLLEDCRPAVLMAQQSAYAAVIDKVLEDHPVALCISTSELDFQTRNDPRLFAQSRRQVPAGTLDLLALTGQYAGRTPPEVHYRGEDTALLVYTSGTTGLPKGAMNTHGNVAFAAQVYREGLQLKDGATVLALAPLFHVTGLIGHVALCWLIAGPLVLTYRFEPGVILDAIAEYRPTYTVGAITAYIALMNHPGAKPDSFSSFQAISSGGAPIPPAVVEQFEEKFHQYIYNGYGLTESTSPAIVTPVRRRAPVDATFGALSVGVPTFNTYARVCDSNTGALLGVGQEGEIFLKGPQVVPGYWNKPEETAKALQDGWLATGDIGVMNAEGWVFIVDRKKDMISASGYKVWPREVEDVLYAHPAVREAAVVGIPDAYRGETVKAVLSLKPGARVTAEAIIGYCKERMAAYKYPRVVEFLPDLPKTATGKILRRALRKAVNPVSAPAGK
ncbi:MAG: class I adenylate-forming enzyme family protein [Rhodanobacteraceae bacterium]